MNTPTFLLMLWRFLREVADRFVKDRCQRVAGALSFTTVLSIVPLTAVILAVFSLFPGFSSWMAAIQDFIYSNFVPAAGEAVQKHLFHFASKAGRLTAVGLTFLVVTSIMLMATIEQALNDIWRVPNTRKLLHRFLAYWALLTLVPLLVGGSLTLTSRLLALPLFEQLAGGSLRSALGVALPLAFEFGGVVLLYVVVPNIQVVWRDAIIGGVLTAVLLETAKLLFGGSMKYFSSYTFVYGAIAALPVFLIWVYISWVIILLGAIVTATLTAWRADDSIAYGLRAGRTAD